MVERDLQKAKCMGGRHLVPRGEVEFDLVEDVTGALYFSNWIL